MKSLKVLSEVASRYKVIIVDDVSPDRSGEIADKLSKKHPDIISVYYEKTLDSELRFRLVLSIHLIINGFVSTTVIINMT